MRIWLQIIYILLEGWEMNKPYCSQLPKEILIYNIQYHLLNFCSTKEECVALVKTLLENFEAKNNDRKDE